MILILSGGVHADSTNKMLALHVEQLCKKQNASAEFIDLASFDIPLLNPANEDLSSPTQDIIKLREKFEKASGFYLTTPEYNGGITPVLSNTLNSVFNFVYFPKNTMDPIINKPALTGSASPSIYGATKACSILNSQLLHMGAILCPFSASLSKSHEMFDKDGKLSNPEAEKRLEQGVDILIRLSQ